MVDSLQPDRAPWRSRRDGMRELVLPHLSLGALLDEIDEAAPDAFDRRDLHLFWAYRLRETSNLQALGAIERGGNVVDAEPERAHRCAVHDVVAVREALGLAVDDDVDV